MGGIAPLGSILMGKGAKNTTGEIGGETAQRVENIQPLCLNRVASLWHSSSRTCVISRGKVSFLDRCQTQIFLAVTGLWGSGKVSLLPSKKFFTNVVATSHSSCVFLYLFSSANISPVRFVLHLQDWWCVGKRETTVVSPSINCDWFTCRCLCGL